MISEIVEGSSMEPIVPVTSCLLCSRILSMKLRSWLRLVVYSHQVHTGHGDQGCVCIRIQPVANCMAEIQRKGKHQSTELTACLWRENGLSSLLDTSLRATSSHCFKLFTPFIVNHTCTHISEHSSRGWRSWCGRAKQACLPQMLVPEHVSKVMLEDRGKGSQQLVFHTRWSLSNPGGMFH